MNSLDTNLGTTVTTLPTPNSMLPGLGNEDKNNKIQFLRIRKQLLTRSHLSTLVQ